LAEAKAIAVEFAEIAVLPSRPHDQGFGRVWDLVPLKNEHFKLSKLVFVYAAYLNLFNGVVVRNVEPDDPLLILFKVDVVHFARAEVNLSF
jgi:hypothetical protein